MIYQDQPGGLMGVVTQGAQLQREFSEDRSVPMESRPVKTDDAGRQLARFRMQVQPHHCSETIEVTVTAPASMLEEVESGTLVSVQGESMQVAPWHMGQRMGWRVVGAESVESFGGFADALSAIRDGGAQ